jgi:TATA-box binding protein (TBP) (component of TFIID and TFIIIB)
MSSSELNISTLVYMLDTNLTILPENLEQSFNNIDIVNYFDNLEGIIKVALRGNNKGECKKTIYQKNKGKKVQKKTFQNQLSLYIRVFEEKPIKYIKKIDLKSCLESYEGVCNVEKEKQIYIYEYKKGQTAFQYNKFKFTFDNSSANKENYICVKSIVNRKSIPDTIILNESFNGETVEYDIDKVGFSNCLIFESSTPIKNIIVNFIVEVNMFVFTSGKIKVAGCTTETQIDKAMNSLANNILSDNEENKLFDITRNEFEIKNKSSTMINSDFRNDFEVKRFELDDLVREKYKLICSYEPCTHPAVIIKYYCNNSHDDKSGRCLCRDLYGNKNFCVGRGDCTKEGGCKSVTILVFQSGKVIITGGRLLYQVNLAYNFIKTILSDNRKGLENKK